MTIKLGIKKSKSKISPSPPPRIKEPVKQRRSTKLTIHPQTINLSLSPGASQIQPQPNKTGVDSCVFALSVGNNKTTTTKPKSSAVSKDVQTAYVDASFSGGKPACREL